MKKNILYKLLYELLIIAVPIITTPYVSRVLEADGVGINSYIGAYMSYFVLFGTLGTVNYGTKLIASNRDNYTEKSKAFWELEGLSFITCLLALVLWLVFSGFRGDNSLYFYAMTPVIIANMLDISWLYVGCEKIGYTVFVNSICKVGGVIGLFIFVKSKNDLFAYIIINSMALLLGSISMWLFLPKMVGKVELKEINVWKHFKESVDFFIPTIMVSVYQVLDKILIQLITNDDYQNGYYEQTIKIITLLKTLVYSAVGSVVSARVSYHVANHEWERVSEKILQVFEYVFFMGCGCVFGLISISNVFVRIFFGKGYEEVSLLLKIISPLLVICGISSSMSVLYYMPTGKNKQLSKCIFVGSVINLIINGILIPRWGAMGAVLASVVAEGVIMFLTITNCEGIISFVTIIKCLYKKIIAGFFMAVILCGLKSSINGIGVLELFAYCAIGLMVYILFLLLLRDNSLKYVYGIVKDKMRY